MTIIKADLKADGRQIRPAFTGLFLNGVAQIKLNGSIVYQALSDRPDETPLNIIYSPLLPQLGAVYSEAGRTFSGLYYSDASPRYIGPIGRYFGWEITYTIGGDFTNAAPTAADEPEPPALLNFSMGVELEDVAQASDLDGKWNANSNGEFFADPIIFKSAIVNFNYRRREYSNPLTLIDAYFQAVNSAPWHGLAAGRVKVAEITFTAAVGQTSTTYEVDYKLQYRRAGWNVEKANAGMYYNAGGALARALNADGSPVDNPVLLAANGARLTPGAEPVLLSFRTTYPKDFDELSLPSPFDL